MYTESREVIPPICFTKSGLREDLVDATGHEAVVLVLDFGRQRVGRDLSQVLLQEREVGPPGIANENVRPLPDRALEPIKRSRRELRVVADVARQNHIPVIIAGASAAAVLAAAADEVRSAACAASMSYRFRRKIRVMNSGCTQIAKL